MKSSGDKLCFLRLGITTAVLNAIGTIPVDRDSLIMVVIGSIRQSRWVRSNEVGMGSKEHDFRGELLITDFTKVGVTGSNFEEKLPVNSSN